MKLQSRFEHYMQEHDLCAPEDKILLAVSGGMDSVLMAHLFVIQGYTVGLAHCNFGLRGEASDGDEEFVNQLAQEWDIPYFSTLFDTGSYAGERGISIQMAARELRYQWLENIRETQGYDYIAVAQHQNDNVETVLLNLVRGTGLAGLHGILPKRGRIIRPLLFLSRDEISEAVKYWRLPYREDESNNSTKYARNKIRLEIVPKLKALNPDLEQTFAENIRRFTESHELIQRYADDLRNRLFEPCLPYGYRIPIRSLQELHPQKLLVYELFKPYGFADRVMDDLILALNGISGKQFFSDSHVLLRDRNYLLLKPADGKEYDEVATIANPGDETKWSSYHFRSTVSDDTTLGKNQYIAKFDADKITFPLQIRSWQLADAFSPLGMKGKKKLSDFFISLKIPVYEKKNIPIVTQADGEIIWVAPYRIDERYKITDKTKKVITLTCH